MLWLHANVVWGCVLMLCVVVVLVLQGITPLPLGVILAWPPDNPRYNNHTYNGVQAALVGTHNIYDIIQLSTFGKL